MKKNRIIVIADEGEVLWESLVLPEQQTEIYRAKNIQDALSHLTVCIFRKNRALAPHERSAVPLGTDHCPVC